ncbi:protein of unknown function (plasmid) [Paraburkholderia kururiensis]
MQHGGLHTPRDRLAEPGTVASAGHFGFHSLARSSDCVSRRSGPKQAADARGELRFQTGDVGRSRLTAPPALSGGTIDA